MTQFNVKGDKRFLVIARVGDSSLHKEWLNPSQHRNFDLCLSYFDGEPGRYKSDCDFYHEKPGVKWPILKEIIAAFGDRIDHYDAIWLPDDDISTNAHDINRMFEIFMERQLELAQPALTKDSYRSHKITVVNPQYSLRYCHFIEPMVPIFSRKAFRRLWPTFEKSEAAYGLDFVWPKLLGYPYRKIAIIDEVTVKHTRPVGGGTLYRNMEGDRWEQFRRVTKEYDVEVDWKQTHYEGVPSGKRVMFALLAHRDEDVLEAQLANIRHFNPEAGVIVYNGGRNTNLAKKLNVPVCPYSRPVRWGNLAPYLWDVMRWLDENKVEYDYLVNLDSDMLFVKHGFEAFVRRLMKEYDCMGWDLQESFSPGDTDHPNHKSMWNEWEAWSPVFGTEGFRRYFNPAQVFTRKLVTQMLSAVDHAEIERKFADSEVIALEEYFFVSLAASLNARCREYPRDLVLNVMRHDGEIEKADAAQAIHHPYYYFIHPVKGQRLKEMSSWLESGGKLTEPEPKPEAPKESEPETIKAADARPAEAVRTLKRRTTVAKRRSAAGKKGGGKRKPAVGKAAVRKTAVRKTAVGKTVVGRMAIGRAAVGKKAVTGTAKKQKNVIPPRLVAVKKTLRTKPHASTQTRKPGQTA